MKRLLVGLLVIGGWGASVAAAAEPETESPDCREVRQYTFSWQYRDSCEMTPRGGTSRGSEITLAEKPHPAWQKLQQADLDKFERDRRAILAMAGGYRVTFDFLETVGYTPGFEPDPPYQSWGTEYVYVVEDQGDFISLQHIMVMEYVDEEGEVHGPIVQKHWRQDWQYEKRDILTYAGEGKRRHKKLSQKEVKGTWAQAVFQVDDSPRYESYGRWQHDHNRSTWVSHETWRPLPRRESTFRDDYDALIGTNRHTITPSGWVHQQDNFKIVLAAPGQLRADQPYLSQEVGMGRYQRIVDFDFSAGDRYWERTGPFWADVRKEWARIINNNDAFVLNKTIDGTPLFMALFQMARAVNESGDYQSGQKREQIRQTLNRYVETQ